MTDIKLLIGIKKSLSTALIDINNLNNCINKRCWQEMVEDLIKDILPFLDSLDRALEHRDSSDAQAFKDGIALIQDQFLCCLKKHGVERIESIGADFDPNFHEALMRVDSVDHQDNQVVSEMEKGYLLNGRLIRPSRVCVCKKTGENSDCEISEANGE